MQRNPHWEGLRLRLVHATSNRGRKAELARELGVHRQTVSLWLSEEHTMPSAETTLWLQNWVTEAERKEANEKKRAGGAITPPAPRTRKAKSTKNEKANRSQRR
jgi:transcriptional regulator with XRE-family HTH domain